MKNALFVFAFLLTASSLSPMVRAGVNVGPDPYYNDPYYNGVYFDGYWYGPGWYYGNYYNTIQPTMLGAGEIIQVDLTTTIAATSNFAV